jgi:hypothetical protein
VTSTPHCASGCHGTQCPLLSSAIAFSDSLARLRSGAQDRNYRQSIEDESTRRTELARAMPAATLFVTVTSLRSAVGPASKLRPMGLDLLDVLFV